MEKYKKIASDLGKVSKKSTWEIVKDSFGLLSPKEMTVIRFTLTLFLSIAFSLSLAFCYENSYEIINEISSTILDIQIALFGLIFTGYSIFQALLSPQIIYFMLCANDEKSKKKHTAESESMFNTSNSYYISYVVLVIIDIFISFVIKELDKFIPTTWNLSNNICVNNVLFAVLVFGYVFLTIVTLVESLCFVANIYKMYNVAALEKFFEEIERQSKSDE